MGRLATWLGAAVLLVVGLVGFWVGNAQGGDTERDEVLALAESFVKTFTTYDYRSFEETEAAIADASTQAFTSRYTSLLGGAGFVTAIEENQARATSEIINGPLLATFEDHEARAFAIVDQTVIRAGAEEPQTARLRVEVFYVETPDGWRVVDVETT